ncbi:LysR family transcriptional regulator [Frankia tisae]|uniref:LysR family transcriptional regulator n=1 Tax=Frankia tisae TaxID=2950104 RepID=UPI0035566613
MDLESVRTFVSVSDTGQFQHIAAEMAIAQRIAKLEEDFGVRLFTRTTHRCHRGSTGRRRSPPAPHRSDRPPITICAASRCTTRHRSTRIP